MYKNFIKPIFDFVFAILMLIVSFPFLIFIFMVLFIHFKSIPLFIQQRPGKNQKLFKIIKFKTMNEEKDQDGNLLPDDKRLTKLGFLIRSLSLDELPQLINVVKGDLSFIGPRPLLVEYLPLYNAFENQRHNVKPGISGWAQVNGRNAISWKKKFEYDVYYVNNVSFLLDLKVLIKTVVNILRRKDISSTTSVTVEKYNGKN